MIAEGYSMDLYCDADTQHLYNMGRASFAGPSSTDCNKQAKAAGWKISRDRMKCLCPECVKEGLTYAKSS